MSEASPSDVDLESGGIIATDLTDTQIQSFIDDAEFEAEQRISDYQNALTTTEQKQLEKYLAALRIRLTADRSIESTGRETANVSYEGMETEELRRAVDARDPSGTLAYQTDTDRYTGIISND
jgi:hypothetical protein